MLGRHCLKSWSSTQDVVSLSSGEAEYYALVRGSARGLGMRSMLEDMGIKVKLEVKTDASAAKGIAMRKGFGRVRQIEVCQLWVQDRVARGDIEVNKVRTDENLADVLTKYLDRAEIDKFTLLMGLVGCDNRHQLAPGLSG